MKLLGVPHMVIIPFTNCNFKCPYCCSSKFIRATISTWKEHSDDTIKFLNSLDKKMILVTGGGEPLLYDWTEMIEKTNHYWYFATNCSVVHPFLTGSVTREKVKLFIAAFHRTGISVDKFISNVHRLQDLGYAVFCKIIYTREPKQFDEIETIMKANIPVTFTPLLYGSYSRDETMKVLPYCQSTMYASRFFHFDNKAGRRPAPCVAGTKESFAMTGTTLFRCSQYSEPIDRMPYLLCPRFIRRLWNYEKGNIYNPRFDKTPKMCRKQVCECEWHNFSDMGFDLENEKWQQFIETGKWMPASIDDIRVAVGRTGEKYE